VGVELPVFFMLKRCFIATFLASLRRILMSVLLYDYLRPVNGVLIITINGIRATLDDAGSFRNKLLHEIQDGCKIIIVNLEKVEFIDSTFLGAIVVGWKNITAKEGALVLTNLNVKVKDLLTLTQLDKKLNIAATVEDALLLFKASQ
jgi:anti-sigma B factor antagonist